MIDKVNQALEKYQHQFSDLNNAEKILNSTCAQIRINVQQAIAKTNETEIIEEKMKSLVMGLQSVLNTANLIQDNFFRDRARLEIKIETLEDLLLDDLEKVVDSDSE